MGTSAYVMVTVSSKLDISGFIQLLSYYSQVMPNDQLISYTFYFGTNYSTTVVVKNVEEEIQDWVHETKYINQLYQYAQVNNSDQIQYDNPSNPLSGVASNIFHLIFTENQQPATVIKKKQVVLLTDYVPVNLTQAMNSDTHKNEQMFGLYHELDVSSIDVVADFPVFSVDDGRSIDSLRVVFQQDLAFEFPDAHETQLIANNWIFLAEMHTDLLWKMTSSIIQGAKCRLADTKMNRGFIQLQYASNGTVHDMLLPWLGDQTSLFLCNCINHLPAPAPTAFSCSPSSLSVFSSYLLQLSLPSNLTSFVSFISPQFDCFQPNISHIENNTYPTTHARLISPFSLFAVDATMAVSLSDTLFLSHSLDNQILPESDFYLTNYSTTCTDTLPFVPLDSTTPYYRPKYLYIALDDMLWITICASISVTTFGCLIYQHVKRTQKKQMELLNEIMLQPRVYRTVKESAEVARLPWEIKSDRVHIDTGFMLGEGTVSNVYLGKLKGKAPIMQWIDRVEMKQYQDCPVAVRVPRHFDEPEEDQLFREITSMRRLRHHDHIALLLGWTNKDQLVCSLLELTHMNLIKYLGQIEETIITSMDGNIPTKAQSTKYIPYQVLYKVLYEVCDGMSYIHSRNLVHRDLTARNVLLTTGLRAKISGFGFCSEPDDPKFAANAAALRFLPVKWMAPECFQGRFSPASDSWSFAILLYEVFSLGAPPYPELIKPEDIVDTVTSGRLPDVPKYANRSTFSLMERCLTRKPDRRPSFPQLKDRFSEEMDIFYENKAFEHDDFLV